MKVPRPFSISGISGNPASPCVGEARPWVFGVFKREGDGVADPGQPRPDLRVGLISTIAAMTTDRFVVSFYPAGSNWLCSGERLTFVPTSDPAGWTLSGSIPHKRKAAPKSGSKLLNRISVSADRSPPEAQKGPAVTASGPTVVTRTIVGTVKRTIPIDPARDGASAREAIARSAFLADDSGVFSQCRSRH